MKQSTKILALALALTMALGMLAACAPAAQPAADATAQPTDAPAQEGKFTPGTYTATGKGNNGDVTVSVTFSADAITEVTVGEHGETAGISDPAIDRIPAAIVDGQTLAVDTVSGATNTSKAILAAVEDCVKQAGGDVEALKVAAEDNEKEQETVELTADVVVVGGGGAGLAAAVSAGENGAKVILVEKMSDVGGATSLSSGLMLVADTEQQKAAGITEDSLETYIEDVYTRSGEIGDKELITLLCTSANDTMAWLGQHGIVWSDKVQQKPDCTYPRTHSPIKPEDAKGALGDVFTRALQKEAVEKYGAEILLNTEALELLYENEKVCGIIAENSAESTRYEIRAKNVILATGGFAGNPDMARSYDKAIPDNADYYAHPGATGDGIVMAQTIGADVTGMEYIKSILSRTGVTRDITNAIFVNAEGNRFFDEDGKAEDLNAAIYNQTNSNCYMVYDSRTVGEVTEKVQKMLDEGTLFVGDTLEQLAAEIGVDGANLAKTVEEYNAVINGEKEDPFGRTTLGNTIEEGPFYAAERHVQVHYTMGGLKIDKDARVINTEGEPIDGLFAAGEVTGGIHGEYRIGGNSLTEIFVFGRIAGANAAK